MTRKEKRIFFDWLQKHGILKQYRRNIFTSSKIYRWWNDGYISAPFLYAIDAFIWRNTLEGYDFWRDFDDAWTLFARNLYDT